MTDNILTHAAFSDVDLLRKSAPQWHFHTIYKLRPDALKGENSIIQLPHIQLGYAVRNAGILYEVSSPKGTVSLGIVDTLDGVLSYGPVKLKQGDILVFDDKRTYTLTTSGNLRVPIISISRKKYKKLTRMLSQHTDQIISDTEGALSKKLYGILKRFMEDKTLIKDTTAHHKIEEALIRDIEALMHDQIPHTPKLTKGEKIALQIKERIYRHMHGKVSISDFAQEFRVSEQTLQNAFKSLYGFTPNRFLRQLKLNHVRLALLDADPKKDTIIAIANKWGFTHMGHFSHYYTELFGENPSVTLHHAKDSA